MAVHARGDPILVWHRVLAQSIHVVSADSLRGGLIECEYRGCCCQGREHTHANYRCFQNCHSSPVEHITKLMASGSEIASGWSNAASIWPQPESTRPGCCGVRVVLRCGLGHSQKCNSDPSRRHQIRAMFQLFYQRGFRLPQHGEGMWAPLAYAIDFLGILAGTVLILALLFLAWVIVPFILH